MQTIKQSLKTIILAIIIGLAVSYAFAWSEPLNDPPTCTSGNPGCDEPIHTSSDHQDKTGTLGLAGLFTDFDTYLATNSGNVGIGTTNPQETLHIMGNGEILLEDSSVGIFFKDTTNDDFEITTAGDVNGHLEFRAYDGSWDTVMSIDATGSGRVGIGTTNPATKLHVSGGSTQLTSNTTDTLLVYAQGTNNYAISGRATQGGVGGYFNSISGYALLTGTGNVGIGTTSPNSKLQISNGDIYVDTIGTGIILRSADGNCHRIIVDNSSILSAVAITCPTSI